MKKALLFLCSFASLFATAKTPIAFGPEVGVNVSNYYGKFAGITQHFSTSIPGPRLGGVADIGLTKSFYLQPGLCYVRNGYNLVAIGFSGITYAINFRVSTVELPINLLYKVERKDGGRIFVGMGPYLAANVGGHVKSDLLIANRSALSIGSAFTDDINRFDVGIGASAGYQLPDNLFIHLHYQYGVANLLPHGDADNTMYNVNYGVALGYLFGHNSHGMHDPNPKKKKQFNNRH